MGDIYMNSIHDFYDDNSLDFWMMRGDIVYQVVGRSDRTTSMMVGCKKEIMMHAHGHTTVWGTHIGVGRARNTKSWFQRLWDWWAAHKAARQEARLAALKTRWDAKRESVRRLHADAASDLVAPTHAFSTTTALCDLAL